MTCAPIHPGEVLADELTAAGFTTETLARQIKVSEKQLMQICEGQQGITGDIALRLGHWFGMSPRFWMNLQGAYELAVAKAQAGAEIERLPVRADLCGGVMSGSRNMGALPALLASWGPLDDDFSEIFAPPTKEEDIF